MVDSKEKASDDLVGDKDDADPADDGETGNCRDGGDSSDWGERGDEGSRASAAEAAADTHAHRNMCKQVERDPAAECGSGHDIEVPAGVVQGGLEAEGKHDDARNHRRVQVGVNVSGQAGALLG